MATRDDLDAPAPVQIPPGRHGLPREAVLAHQRERMLAALLAEVAAHGYAKTTVQAVAKRAGVSKATFYQHFENLEGCFWAASEAHFYGVAKAIVTVYEAAGPAWRDRIAAGIGALLQYLAEHETFARVIFIEALGVGEGALERRQVMLNGLASYFDPEVRPEMDFPIERPKLAAEATINALSGMLYSRILEGRTAELPRMHRDFVHVALLAYDGA